MKLSSSTVLASLLLSISLACHAEVDVTGIDHVAVRVTNLARSAKWYETQFGFRKLREWNGVWMIGKGNVRVGLFLVDKPTTLNDSQNSLIIEHYAFGVSAEKFQSAVDQMRAAGVAVSAIEDTGIAYSVFMSDPDGHQIELTTYHGNVPTLPKNRNK